VWHPAGTQAALTPATCACIGEVHPACPPAAGHNCLKAELVVCDRGWPLRERFLAALRAKLSSLPNRVAYYPGSDKKHAAFRARFPDVEALGAGSTDADGAALGSGSARAEVRPSPWLLKAGLPPDEAATQDENWCGCIQVGMCREPRGGRVKAAWTPRPAAGRACFTAPPPHPVARRRCAWTAAATRPGSCRRRCALPTSAAGERSAAPCSSTPPPRWRGAQPLLATRAVLPLHGQPRAAQQPCPPLVPCSAPTHRRLMRWWRGCGTAPSRST
jgi:hypothetical protein